MKGPNNTLHSVNDFNNEYEQMTSSSIILLTDVEKTIKESDQQIDTIIKNIREELIQNIKKNKYDKINLSYFSHKLILEQHLKTCKLDILIQNIHNGKYDS